MAKTKTTKTDVDVMDYINSIEDSRKIPDSLELIKIMEGITGLKPYMWGQSIIGFGNYHYKYASGHEGDAPVTGFSPRKAAFSLYVFTGLEEHKYLLNDFGKFKMGKACIYVNKLSDINIPQLKTLIKTSIKYIKTKYE